MRKSRGGLERVRLFLFLPLLDLVVLGLTVIAPTYATDVCPRPTIGSVAVDPTNVRSSDGKLHIDFAFRGANGLYGLPRFCYITPDGLQAPTLRVQPGDELVITLHNELPASPPPSHVHSMERTMERNAACGGGAMAVFSTNLHFHGLTLPPVCHQDETLRTLIQPSDPPFEYRVTIPKDESPGLYWYHPHPHGFTEPQVLGGASGALIVEGIEKHKPEVAGLPERVFILRDQRVPGINESDEDAGPGKDISVNFVPVMYPLYLPASVVVRAEERQFWRVLNASADTYFNLQLRSGATIQDVNTPQPVELIAMDGVPIGGPSKRLEILLSPGARAEFIMTTPRAGTWAQFISLPYDTGPGGSATPRRTLANLVSKADAKPISIMPGVTGAMAAPFVGLTAAKPVRRRKLYFSEDLSDQKAPKYFLTEEGKAPKVFDMRVKTPDITVRHGTTEDWTVENRAREAHTFHIHQLKFQVMERDGARIEEPMLRDTIDLPYWDGESTQYPSVTLRMDFRNPAIIGTFVYHCHILEHEDGGMMGSIQVK